LTFWEKLARKSNSNTDTCKILALERPPAVLGEGARGAEVCVDLKYSKTMIYNDDIYEVKI